MTPDGRIPADMDIHATGEDLLRRMMTLPHASRVKLAALLYAVEDAVEIHSHLRTSASEYHFVIKVVLARHEQAASLAEEPPA